MIKLVCDSTYDLGEKEIAELGIITVPLYVLLGEKTYRDTPEQIHNGMIYDFVRDNGILPKTAAVTVSDYVECFRAILDGGDDIVSTGLSAALSTTFANSVRARDELAEMGYDPRRIRLIDSEHLSTGVAHLLFRARKLIDEGCPLDAIEADLNEYKHRISTSFILDTLEYMNRGGRCSSMVYYAANILNLHPQLHMENGKLVPGEKYRGNYVRKCLKTYFEKVVGEQIDDIEKDLIFCTCSNAGEVLDAAEEMVRSLGVFKRVLATTAGATIASHCGPDCIGFLFVKKK